ncbi:MAG: biopolymer transporter ExbD, partial [Arcobacter sp.]|nr:biopolymer transporter ExbD [Arcobacter sp.]
KDNVNIYITKENEVFINETKINNSEFKAMISEYTADTFFKINCDKEAKFDYFILVLDGLKTLGFSNLAVVTKK